MVGKRRGMTMMSLEMVKRPRMVKQLLRMGRRRRMEKNQLQPMRKLRVMLKVERRRERTNQRRCSFCPRSFLTSTECMFSFPCIVGCRGGG